MACDSFVQRFHSCDTIFHYLYDLTVNLRFRLNTVFFSPNNDVMSISKDNTLNKIIWAREYDFPTPLEERFETTCSNPLGYRSQPISTGQVIGLLLAKGKFPLGYYVEMGCDL